MQRSDGRAESPYETIGRWQLEEAGFEVQPQAWAYDEDGPIGRGDLWIPELWTFLEVDGAVKYSPDSSPFTLLTEKGRQERMERGGFGMARVSPTEIEADRRSLVRRARQAGARAQAVRAALGHTLQGYIGPPPPWAEQTLRW